MLNISQTNNNTFPFSAHEILWKSQQRFPGFKVMHYHQEVQLIFLFSGKIHFTNIENQLDLHPGQGLIINSNTIHLIEPSEDYHYISFKFSEELLKSHSFPEVNQVITKLCHHPDFNFLLLEPTCIWQKQLLVLLTDLYNVQDSTKDYFHFEVLTLLYQFWLTLIKNLKLSHTTVDSLSSNRLTLFLHFIEQHYQEDITLNDIAKSANVSISECLRVFKNSLSVSPHHYLINYRLKKSCALLSNTTIPISKIATTVGFNHSSHFGKAFKKKMKVTPKHYRLLMQKI